MLSVPITAGTPGSGSVLESHQHPQIGAVGGGGPAHGSRQLRPMRPRRAAVANILRRSARPVSPLGHNRIGQSKNDAPVGVGDPQVGRVHFVPGDGGGTGESDRFVVFGNLVAVGGDDEGIGETAGRPRSDSNRCRRDTGPVIAGARLRSPDARATPGDGAPSRISHRHRHRHIRIRGRCHRCRHPHRPGPPVFGNFGDHRQRGVGETQRNDRITGLRSRRNRRRDPHQTHRQHDYQATFYDFPPGGEHRGHHITALF